MPSQLHETLLLLFRNRPSLAADLLRDALHVDLPPHSEVRLESAELSDTVPTEYRADLVVLLVAGKPVLGVIVEAQLRPDARKRLSWPVYITSLRARMNCPCCLLVVTASNSTARWASKPISLGPGSCVVPLVIGPAGVPVVTDLERAKRAPELAVLSVLAHGRSDVPTAIRLATNAVEASASLDEETRVLYFDLIESALSEAARKALAMLPQDYKFRGPTYKKGKLEGKLEGKIEGKLEAKAASVLEVLTARGFDVSAATRRRVEAATDPEQLTHWLRRAAVIGSADELFSE